MITCNCQGLSGGEYHCRKHDGSTNDECECWDECCNSGWYADDGDMVDFMPELSTCGCDPEVDA